MSNKSDSCPRCNSHSPKMHPAVQYGGEVQICPDGYHAPRHVRHHGLMIDASYRRDGAIEYWVVEKGHGRFATLAIAKEIAEHRAAIRAGRA